MITLGKLFERLSYAELSNLSISGEGSGTIIPAGIPKIINYINEALVKLYGRFILSTKQLIIEEQEHITNYHLIRKFAETNTENIQDYPYIKDLPDEPFTEDVIKILEVYDVHGCLYALNDMGNCNSLFTPAPQILQIPNPVTARMITVVYQARHPVILPPVDNNQSQEIDIPFVLEEALQAYIASKVYSNMNGQENILKAQEQLAKYESVCGEVETFDLTNNTISTTTYKLEIRGFV